MTPRQRLRSVFKALKGCAMPCEEGREATADERSVLSRYVDGEECRLRQSLFSVA